MPLMMGTNQASIGANIRELRNAGHPETQAIAIAYKHAGKQRKAKKLGAKGPKVGAKTPKMMPFGKSPKMPMVADTDGDQS